MADPTRECSFDIQLDSEEEVAWFKRSLSLCDNAYGLDEESGGDVIAGMKELGIDPVDIVDSGFGWALVQDRLTLTIYSDDYPNIEAMAAIVTAYLRAFEKKSVIGFTYSDGCTKPRAGCFGGGVVVCTKDGAQFSHTDTVFSQMVETAEATMQEGA